MSHAGRDEDTVPGADEVVLSVEVEDHGTGQHDLFVFDGRVAMARNPPARREGEPAGEEPRGIVLGADQDLDGRPAAAVHLVRRDGGRRTDDWNGFRSAHGRLLALRIPPGYDPPVLERLSVAGLGIIDRVDLDFRSGFTVLTGETGAGKSLLVESLKLIAGDRARSDMVRSGADRLQVTAWFTELPPPALEVLEDLGLDGWDELVVRREVTAAGRSRCFVNDVPVTAGGLQRLAPHLLAIHGQHEQYGLADSDVQRGLVDQFGGLGDAVDGVRRRHQIWRDRQDEVDRLTRARSGRRDRLDVIAFQAAEIDSVAPVPGEIEELGRRRQALRHAVRLQELSHRAVDLLAERDNAVVDCLAGVERALAEMIELGQPLDDTASNVAAARIAAEEAVREIQSLVGEIQEDPTALETIESRLHLLDALCLKYGSDLEAVAAHRRRLEAERAELESVEDRLDQARGDAATGLAEFDTAARGLQDLRRDSAGRLVRRIEQALSGLDMAGASLRFDWQARPDADSPLIRDGEAVAFTEMGVEEAELLLAANRGEELRPMARVASGGELSRIHLAIRTAMRSAHSQAPMTVLFDEVDSGLGGRAAGALADLLASLADLDQVLVVTHLPQVAARASGHFKVEKVAEGDRTVTRVGALDAEARRSEIARMLAGGSVTEAALVHANEMLEAP